MATLAEINQIIEPAVTALEYELVGCELEGGTGHQVLRVYVEGPDGVTLDACAQLSRQVSAVLEVEDPISTRYRLEVSSPGLDRPLFTLAHYERFVGQRVRLRTRYPQDQGQRNFKGLLAAVADEQITLQTEEGQTLVLAFNDIDRANVIPDI